MKTQYFIEVGEPSSYSMWRIVDKDGFVVCHLHGPMSAKIALAAVEKLKEFEDYGWLERLINYSHNKN